MATKSKAPAKAPRAAKSAAKTVGRTAGKVTARKAAKPTPARTASVKKPAKAAAAKPAAKKGAKAVAAKPAAKVPARQAPVARPSAKPAAAPGVAAVVGTAAIASLPPPKPPVRAVPVVSPQELASAHEYLLARSAGRSEEPVIVDGRPLLTEEQLLAMPDSEYMNGEQLAFFRYRLQQMERELLSNADETTEHLRETVIVPDPADRATIEEEHALELRTRDRERKLLKKVQSSLQQIDSGEYGYCEETGDPIGIPRLLARPTATLSLEAQQRREIKQKLFGD